MNIILKKITPKKELIKYKPSVIRNEEKTELDMNKYE